MSKFKILVVEDSESLREEISFILNMEGFEVFEAADGKIGLEMAVKYEPDLIISDIQMPIMDGFELIKNLQLNLKTALIPVIFLTAKTTFDDIRKGMNLGGADYLTKPFLAEDLVNSIKGRLKNKKLVKHRLDKVSLDIGSRIPEELKSPLHEIIGYSYLMKENEGDFSEVEKSDMLEAIHSNANTLLDHVENYLFYTELELVYKGFKKNQVNITSLNVDKILNQSIERKKSKHPLIDYKFISTFKKNYDFFEKHLEKLISGLLNWVSASIKSGSVLMVESGVKKKGLKIIISFEKKNLVNEEVFKKQTAIIQGVPDYKNLNITMLHLIIVFNNGTINVYEGDGKKWIEIFFGPDHKKIKK